MKKKIQKILPILFILVVILVFLLFPFEEQSEEPTTKEELELAYKNQSCNSSESRYVHEAHDITIARCYWLVNLTHLEIENVHIANKTALTDLEKAIDICENTNHPVFFSDPEGIVPSHFTGEIVNGSIMCYKTIVPTIAKINYTKALDVCDLYPENIETYATWHCYEKNILRIAFYDGVENAEVICERLNMPSNVGSCYEKIVDFIIENETYDVGYALDICDKTTSLLHDDEILNRISVYSNLDDCYEKVTDNAFNKSWSENVSNVCERLNDTKVRDSCYFNLFGLFLKIDMERALEFCDRIFGKGEKCYCYGEFGIRLSNDNVEEALDFCTTKIATDTEKCAAEKWTCYSKIAYRKVLNKTTAHSICDRIYDSSYRNGCHRTIDARPF